MPRLKLKTKLVLAISGMVFVLVAALSCIYVSQMLRQRINQSYDNADFIAHQVLHAARQAVETELPGNRPEVNGSPQDESTQAIAAILRNDGAVTTLLQSIIGYNAEVYDTALTDRSGVPLVDTDASVGDKPIPRRPSLSGLRDGGFLDQLRAVYGPARVYEVTLPVQRQGAPFGEIRVGLSTLFLKQELVPQLNRALLLSGVAVLLSLVSAAFLSNLALRPLGLIARRLDAMTVKTERPEPETERTDEFGAVSNRIDRLGRQMHDVREVFSALKENLDQLMSTLQDGLVLFTRDGRIVLVSASAERFIGRHRGEMLGRSVEEVFTDSNRLGRIVLDAFALRQDVPSREIEIGQGRRVQLSLDFISERGVPIGALLTVRDAESVRRIENEIELSRRLAAIGRLTSGVAHEVKNPINAIVIHLELLRERMLQLDPDTRRHMDIINSEIHRLDRVVKTLVDFSRPVELKLTALDLRSLVSDVLALASPEARSRKVEVVQDLGTEPLPVRVDTDLMKQAVLNVVINGVQAMPDGGTLTVRAFISAQAAVLEVQDTGAGISPEIRDKIFNLYFTTKKSGSGIGLALTYRAMQLHNGALDLDSEVQQGTIFRFMLPLTMQAGDAEKASDTIDESVIPPPH